MASDYTYKMHSDLQIFSGLSRKVGDKQESYPLFNLKQELTATFYIYPCEKQAEKPKVFLASSHSFSGLSSQCLSCWVNTQLDKGSTVWMWCFKSCWHSFLFVNWIVKHLLKFIILLSRTATDYFKCWNFLWGVNRMVAVFISVPKENRSDTGMQIN